MRAQSSSASQVDIRSAYCERQIGSLYYQQVEEIATRVHDMTPHSLNLDNYVTCWWLATKKTPTWQFVFRWLGFIVTEVLDS